MRMEWAQHLTSKYRKGVLHPFLPDIDLFQLHIFVLVGRRGWHYMLIVMFKKDIVKWREYPTSLGAVTPGLVVPTSLVNMLSVILWKKEVYEYFRNGFFPNNFIFSALLQYICLLQVPGVFNATGQWGIQGWLGAIAPPETFLLLFIWHFHQLQEVL